jgi:hypothetical protein
MMLAVLASLACQSQQQGDVFPFPQVAVHYMMHLVDTPEHVTALGGLTQVTQQRQAFTRQPVTLCLGSAA